MTALLEASIAFPAVIYSVVLVLALIYWLFVVLGALDIDLFHGGDADVVPDLDGVAKGALEGAVKGTLEGAAKGAAEGLDPDGMGEGGMGDLVAAMHLTRAPATVVLTVFAAFGWLTSVLAQMHLAPGWGSAGLSGWLFKIVTLMASLVVALPLTSLVVRPLGQLFVTREAQSRMDLVGKVVVVSTGRVDGRFGQATLADGGAGLILDVRCDEAGALRHGDRALLVSWDAEREAFVVEPMEDVLVERRFQQATSGERLAPMSNPLAADEDSEPERRRRAS